MGAPTVNTQLRFPYPTLIEGVFNDRLRLISEGYRAPFGSVGRALNPDDAVPLDQVQELIAAAVSAIGPSAPIEIGWTQIYSMVGSGDLIDGATYVIKDCPTTDKAGVGFPEIYFTAYKVDVTNPVNSDPYTIIPGPNVVMRHGNIPDALIYGEVDWMLNSGGSENPRISRVCDYFNNDISAEVNIVNCVFNNPNFSYNYCDKWSQMIMSAEPGFGAFRCNRAIVGGTIDFDGSIFSLVENNTAFAEGKIVGNSNLSGTSCYKNTVSNGGQLDVAQSLFDNDHNNIEFSLVSVKPTGGLSFCEMRDPNGTSIEISIDTVCKNKTCNAFFSDFEGFVDVSQDLLGTDLMIRKDVFHCGIINFITVASGTTIANIKFQYDLITGRPFRIRVNVGETKGIALTSVAQNTAANGDMCFPLVGPTDYILTIGKNYSNKTLEIQQHTLDGSDYFWQLLNIIDFN